jgi:putative transposase
MKFGFIAKHRGIWPVAWLCPALGVSRSGFHAWLGRSPGQLRDMLGGGGQARRG